MASLASSRVREVEHRSVSACKCESSAIVICEDGWKFRRRGSVGGAGADDDKLTEFACADDRGDGGGVDSVAVEGYDVDGNGLVKCQVLEGGTSIRVAPMERACGGWSSDHFHEHLRLPEGSPVGKGMVVLLEAMGRECIAVALSPYHSYELGKTYVVHLGANGNMQTVLRRHTNYQECVDTTVPSRVCAEDAWVPYWIVLQGGRLSAGVGRVPGKRCVGTMDDSMYDMLRSGVDAAKYVGIGNSALQRNARDVRVRNVAVMSIPPHFGLDGVPIEEGGKFVNVMDTEYGGRGDRTLGGVVPTDAELLTEYEKERSKARARAAKFGVEYKEPAPDAFLKWSEARRLRANPEKGFITGIDTFSATEKAKAKARKERFAREERKRKGLPENPPEEGDDDNVDSNPQGGEEEGMEEDDKDDVAEWEKTKRDPLPVEQAWENWKMVERFRVDPPTGLFAGGDGSGEIVLSGSFSNDIWHGNGGGDLADGSDGETETKEFIPKKVWIVPTKIHIFSVDWAPFKQIRTDDLLSYFRDYGPSYVEWLGELSCNVLFEDKHSAARAFQALSQELPSPPPEFAIQKPSPQEEAAEDTEEANTMEETKDGPDNDGVEREKGSMDTAEGDDIEDNSKQQQEEEPLPDFGGMGWRFCKWTVRKVSNDRHGRRGTRARVLMRLATSMDVLDERPTEWPKPPPGFSTKRVLMPWHDFSGKRRHSHRHGGERRDTKRRRRGGGGRRGDGRGRDDGDCAGGEEHPGLSKGLRSGRARKGGFTVEELEAERNAKNAQLFM